MRVLLCTKERDHTSLGYRYAEALKSIGVEARMIAGDRLRYSYPEQAELYTPETIDKYSKEADIIHILHSQAPPNLNMKGKKIVVQHTGSYFKKYSKKCNRVFNPIAGVTIIGGSLSPVGVKNPVWISGGVVDTSKLTPSGFGRVDSKKLFIGHFPSLYRVDTKGTPYIEEVMKSRDLKKSAKLKFKYITGDTVSWEENIKRVSGLDIYIERTRLSDWPTCSFGISTLEACALGKIVVTNLCEEYKEKGQRYGLITANNPIELKDRILWLLSLTDFQLEALKKSARAWVVQYHSYEAIAKKLLNIYKEL